MSPCVCTAGTFHVTHKPHWCTCVMLIERGNMVRYAPRLHKVRKPMLLSSIRKGGEKDEKGKKTERRDARRQEPQTGTVGGGRGHSQLTAASTLGSAHTAVLARGMELPGCCWSLGSLCGLPDPRGEYEYANAAEVCACSAFVYVRTLLHAACSQPPLRSDTLRLDFPVSVFKCSGPANHRRPARARLGKCV